MECELLPKMRALSLRGAFIAATSATGKGLDGGGAFPDLAEVSVVTHFRIESSLSMALHGLDASGIAVHEFNPSAGDLASFKPGKLFRRKDVPLPSKTSRIGAAWRGQDEIKVMLEGDGGVLRRPGH